MKIHKKIVLIAITVVIVLAVAGFILTHSGLGIDKNNLPKFIQANFIDLDKIFSISKFRSAAGHSFAGGSETCRSMKHYIVPQYDAMADQYMQAHNGFPAPPDGKTDIPIFSPVDGIVTQIGAEQHPVGKQIFIIPDKASQFTIRLFHVYPKDGLSAGGLFGIGGSHVKAGEQIGVIPAHSDTDISVQIGTMPWNENFVSVFDVMPDNVFAAYQKRGVTARSDLILSKEYRDAHPLQCNDEEFVQTDQQKQQGPGGSDEDFFHLSGYKKPEYNQPQMPRDGGPGGQTGR